MFKAKYVIEHARDVLQDLDGDRYSDVSLIRCLSQGVQEVRRLRPDFFIGRYYEVSDGPISMEEYINLPLFLFSPLMNYVVGMAEMRDDEFTTDSRAVTMLTMFRQQLGAE
jgi:hypothetical protein